MLGVNLFPWALDLQLLRLGYGINLHPALQRVGGRIGAQVTGKNFTLRHSICTSVHHLPPGCTWVLLPEVDCCVVGVATCHISVCS